MVITLEESDIKEAIYADNTIMVGDSTLRNNFSPQPKNIPAQCKFMLGCECCLYSKSIISSLLSWWGIYLKKLKDQIQNSQNIMSGEISNFLFETYKNSVMLHVWNSYQIASDMFVAKMCTYSPSQHALPHWKFMLSYCSNCTRIYLLIK